MIYDQLTKRASCYCRICTSTSTFTINFNKDDSALDEANECTYFAVGLLHGNNPSSSRREHPCCTTTSSSGHGTNRQTQPSLALALTSLLMAKLILVLWVVQSASTSGGQRCAAPREVGGTNDVTVSNRVNLVDPGHHVGSAKPILCTCRAVGTMACEICVLCHKPTAAGLRSVLHPESRSNNELRRFFVNFVSPGYQSVAYLAWSSGCWSTPLSSGTTASSVPQHKYCQ